MGSCPLFLFRACRALAFRRGRRLHGSERSPSGCRRCAGLAIWDIQSRREAGGHVVRVFIDRPGPSATPEESVSIEDCEQVNREIEHDSRRRRPAPLRVHARSVVAGPRSAAARHRRLPAVRRTVAKVVVGEAVDNQKAFEGRLRGVDGDDVLLEAPNGRMHRLPLRLITRGRLEWSLSRAADRISFRRDELCKTR